MRDLIRKLFPLLAFALVFSSFSAGSAPAKTAAQKKKEIEAKMAQADKEYKSVMEKKLYYDELASDMQGDIDELADIVSGLDGDIAARNEEITAANEKLDLKRDSFAKRLRALQQRGAMSYMDVIFGASDFSDFLVRLTLVGDIIDHDKSMINEIAAIKNELTAAKSDLESKRGQKQEAYDLAASQQARLSEMSDKQESAMNELMADKEQYKKEYAAAQKQMEIETEKAKAAAAAPKTAAGNPVVFKPSGNSRFMWPVPAGGRVTCPFGYRTDPVPSNHTGMDIAIATGNAIVAANAGVVTTVANNSSGYGKYLIINHGDGSATLYAHTSQIYVTQGTKVEKGQKIAAVGSTGFSTGPHLHFEVIINGVKVNPAPYISN